MRYIWNMGISGSVLTLLYLFGKYLLRVKVDPKWRCLALRGILLYYLLPLTFLKRLYEKALRRFALMPYSNMVYQDFSKSAVIYTDGRRYLNQAFCRELFLGGIWVAAGCGVMAFLFVRYRKGKKMLDGSGGRGLAQTAAGDMERLQRDRGVRRQVGYLDSTAVDGTGKTAFTVGILHPVIFYPACREERERRLIVEHELAHVRHCDQLWQILASAACILHCINPLVWYLRRELEQAAEIYCDWAVLEGKDAQERHAYGKLLLDMAESNGRAGWTVALSGSGKRLKERMEGIMEKKKYLGKVISAAIVTMAVLLNTLTVFAYSDVQVHVEDEIDSDRFEVMMNGMMDEEFTPIGMEWEGKLQFEDYVGVEIRYDRQFMDEEGNIYPVPETEEAAETYAVCNHQYVQGQCVNHVRNGSGGCTTTVYRARRCKLCGKTIYEEVLGVYTETYCNH